MKRPLPLLLLATATTTTTVFRVQSFAVQAAVSNRNSNFLKILLSKQQQTPSSSILRQKVNGEQEDTSSSSSSSDLAGKTGWTHSKPKEDSEFWEPGPEATKSSSSSSLGEPALRTGWLHNKQPSQKPAPPSVVAPLEDKADSSSSSGDQKTGGISQAQRRLQLAMRQQERNHRILSPPSFHACGEGRSIVVTEHQISVPLTRTDDGDDDNSNSNQIRIDVYFSIAEKVTSVAERQWFEQLATRSPTQRAGDYVNHHGMENADDMILYLQGGPGFGAPTPVVGLGLTATSSWAGPALEQYKRVVLMDQRGTGRSTPVTKQTLEQRFPELFLLDDDDESAGVSKDKTSVLDNAVAQTVEFLSQFRADNIVQDAEDIREALLVPMETDDVVRPWGASLGQSFGGFCTMTYLSQVEHPPKVCLLTGGIAPMMTPTYDVYSSLWGKVKQRSLSYYDFYPGDIPVVKRIVQQLLKSPATLPSGGTLTARRFLQLGLGLGGSPSSFAHLHKLFNTAFLQPIIGSDDELAVTFSRAFLKQIDIEQSFDEAPIYFWLHESIYANGPPYSPTEWAAHRAYSDKVASFPEFDYKRTCLSDSDDEPVLFFGEMVFPWMAEDYQELSGVGLTLVANQLAAKKDWGPLFDSESMRKALNGRSQAAAAVYYDDLYVDFDCSMAVASRGGPLEKCKVWITNDFQHSGLRDDGANIFKKLHGMVTGTIRTPS